MKKTYISPDTKVIDVEAEQLICDSLRIGPNGALQDYDLSNGRIYFDDFDDEDDEDIWN